LFWYRSVVGIEALSHEDLLHLEFMEKFERQFVKQGAYENRTIFDSLAIAWELLRTFPKELLKRVKVSNLEKYYKRS